MPHAPDIRVRTLIRLGRHEVYRGQCFHAGLLFEGHGCSSHDSPLDRGSPDVASPDGTAAESADGAPADGAAAGRYAFDRFRSSRGGRARRDHHRGHRLDVHLPGDPAPFATAPLVHTAEFIHPFGPDAVIVVGKHFLPRAGWRTYHTVARVAGGRLRVRTRMMPSWLQVEQFGGSPRAMFFNEPGSRQIYRWSVLGPRALGPEVFLPGTMIVAGTGLYVLERNHVLRGRENLARIDLVTRTIARTFPTTRRGLSSLVDLPDTPWLAVAETGADQVLIVERATNRLARAIPVPGGPVAVARLGRHLVVFCDEPRRIDFLDPADDRGTPLARWSLADSAAHLCHVTAIDVDQATGEIYLRSPFHPLVEDHEPAVTMISDSSGLTLARLGLPRAGGPHIAVRR